MLTEKISAAQAEILLASARKKEYHGDTRPPAGAHAPAAAAEEAETMNRFDFPKIELHLHLDGSIPAQTMWELAAEGGITLPAATPEEWQQYLIRTADCRDVNEYLARFEYPLQMLQTAENLARVTREELALLASQSVAYCEIRFAPQLHTRARLTQRDAVEAVLDGRRQALAAHPEIGCGILLCAMSIGPETCNMEQNLETVRLTREYLGRGVAGLDLAGAEGIVPLHNFHPVFDLARELDVPFTCHAGDSQGPDTVRDALDFGARRIGHGHHIFDAPELWPRAIENGVTLEICPTSNIQCRTQPSFAAHPAKKLFDAGLRVTINTDNMALANTDLDKEYAHCVDEMGFTMKDLVQMNIYAAEAAFMEDDERRRLLARLTAAQNALL